MNAIHQPESPPAGCPVFYDPRWTGQHGIARFAQEITARLPGAIPLAIRGRQLSPVDPLAITAALWGKRCGVYFSPGFNPPLVSPIPIAFTIHDLIPLKVAEESSPVRRLYFSSVVRPAARRARCIFTVSEFSKQEIIEWAGIAEEKVIVVGNAPAAAFNPEGPRHQPGHPYFLHVGRRVAHKNIARLVAAFAASRIPRETRLFFTGEADDATRKLVEKYHLSDRVTFTGPIDDQVLAAYYRGALALIFPSLYEGFGLPIVEAMACGTPVITSAVGATCEIAGSGNALLVTPMDTDALSSAIDTIAHDPEVPARLAKAGLDRAELFSWDRSGSIICQALQAACAA